MHSSLVRDKKEEAVGMKKKKKFIYGCILAALACSLPGQTGYAAQYSSDVYGTIIAPMQPDEPTQPEPVQPEEVLKPSGNQAVKNQAKARAAQFEGGSITTGIQGQPTESGSIQYQLREDQKGRISVSIFTQAVSEKRNIEISIVSVDGLTEYKIRMNYGDILEEELTGLTELVFDLKTPCKNQSQIEACYALGEAETICMCGWPKLPGKAYVDVPVTWTDGTLVKEYEYHKDTKKLELLETGLSVKSGTVTIAYTPGADIVLSKTEIELAKTISNWVDAVKEDRIDKKYSSTVILFAVVSILVLAGGSAIGYKIHKDKKEREKGDE